MTADDLLAEQERHREDLAAALGLSSASLPGTQPASEHRRAVPAPALTPRPSSAAPAPSRAVRESLVDGLPPDVRDHTITVRAAGS